MEYPAKTLKDAFNACDPAQALDAGDPRYVDLTPGRGDEASAAVNCARSILRSAEPLAQLFAGHRGCGKSTELRRLQRDLEGDKYFVAYVEAELDVDLQDTEPTDVLLAVVRRLDLALREAKVQIPADHLEEIVSWFAEVVLEKTERSAIEAAVTSEAEIGGSVPLLGKLLARFTGQIKTGSDSKRAIRRKLDPQLSQLLGFMRSLTTAARSALQRLGKKDLVVIVDSLDRIVLKELSHGSTTHEALFVERGELLRGLGCHTVYTVPISLLFSPRHAILSAIFPDRHLVPMVKTSTRPTRDPWPPGRGLLLDLLAKRLDLASMLEEGAVETLIEASGGHPRQLMQLARDAISMTNEPPVTRSTTRRAVQHLVNDYGRATPKEHWEPLARVYESRQVQNDAIHQEMLFNLSVLEYQNDDRWCDVNPVVTRLSQFEAALESVRLQARKPKRARKPRRPGGATSAL